MHRDDRPCMGLSTVALAQGNAGGIHFRLDCWENRWEIGDSSARLKQCLRLLPLVQRAEARVAAMSW
jgi:hypothetical protein